MVLLLLPGSYSESTLWCTPGVWLAPEQGTLALAAAIPQLLVLLGCLCSSCSASWRAAGSMARGLADLGQLALLAAFWSGNRRFLHPGRRSSTPAIFGMGQGHLAPGVGALPGISSNIFLIWAGLYMMLLAPILAIVIAFGAHGGWLGFGPGVRISILLGAWRAIGGCHSGSLGTGRSSSPALAIRAILSLVWLRTVFFTTGLAIVLGYAVLEIGKQPYFLCSRPQ